jgi:hypothetical protein
MEEKKNKKKTSTEEIGKKVKKKNEKEWKKPTLEDVSGQVMAQPYIRFT